MNCVYCGQVINADYDHFHGSVSKVCRYTRCASDWQNFKIRIKKNKKSKSPIISEFTMLIEEKVFEKGEPALSWNRQLITMKKMQNKLPIIPVKQ